LNWICEPNSLASWLSLSDLSVRFGNAVEFCDLQVGQTKFTDLFRKRIKHCLKNAKNSNE
jgi:hypothetical protein